MLGDTDRRIDGQGAAAGVEDDIGDDLFTADHDLGGIVAAIADIGDRYPERFWHWERLYELQIKTVGGESGPCFYGFLKD